MTSSNSRRILFEELKNYKSNPSVIIDDQEAKKQRDTCPEIWKRLIKHSHNYAEIWEEERKFAETDMKQSKWMYRGVLDNEESDEITATFEFEILDQLLQELVDQVFSL